MSYPSPSTERNRFVQGAFAPWRQIVIKRSRSPISSAPKGSDRSIALEHDPVQIPDFADRVVSVCFVHQTAIILYHEIADLPFVAVLESLLGCVFEKLMEQRQRFLFWHSDNLFDADWIDVDRLAACPRMRSDDRMNDRSRRNLLSLFRQARELSLAVFALIDVSRLQAVDALLHLFGKRIVCLVHVNELRVAAGLRELHGINRRRLRRLDIIRVIGVVSLAGDVDPPVLAFILIRGVVDLRTFGDSEARIVLQKDLAEDLHS